MFGIPDWALGVALIALVVPMGMAGARILLARFAPGADVTGAGAAAKPEELAELRQRVGDLEERLDFAERMLAQQRDAQRLGPAPK